ncbi:phosphoglycolate phosphatase [Rhodoferax sp. UBA5149]|uniref:phosphoglycolate phosphatase n=1 Tax=Rhodoferax sp. UBA5149 TaxID=1947379 RepID=UPI0025FC6494|nr:phosphoglycolate phosphatase [Rhodoferax sp. UBA5149]
MKQFDVDAVIVDLDGTMVDTLGDFVVALNLMLADLPQPHRSYQVTRATVARLVGKGSEHLIKSVLAHVSTAQTATNLRASAARVAELSADALEHLYDQAWPSYQRHYLAINGQHARVYPGVQAGLAYLQARGLKLACLTNKPTVFAQALLKAKGLDGFFELTFGGDAFARKKPDPLPLLKTCEALGCAPQRTLMIGDSSNDAQAARAAGCPVLLVTYGYNHGEPIRAVDADGFTDSLQSLIPSYSRSASN